MVVRAVVIFIAVEIVAIFPTGHEKKSKLEMDCF